MIGSRLAHDEIAGKIGPGGHAKCVDRVTTICGMNCNRGKTGRGIRFRSRGYFSLTRGLESVADGSAYPASTCRILA